MNKKVIDKTYCCSRASTSKCSVEVRNVDSRTVSFLTRPSEILEPKDQEIDKLYEVQEHFVLKLKKLVRHLYCATTPF